MPQESEGLLSPFLRDRRCRIAAGYVASCTNVLDLGSGSGFFASFLSPHIRYTGVDSACGLSPAEVPDKSARRLVLRGSVLSPSTQFLSVIESRAPFDGLLALAFLEHLENPAAALRPFLPYLTPAAQLVITTPHPIGRTVHDFLSKVYVCSRGAAEEHHAFLDRDSLQSLGVDLARPLRVYRRFLLGLNQLAVLQ